ncbi:MAG TPA: hypothetical protein VMV09_10465 [Candidatus Saccharimonadales bacterium]|nr:hypothetical protein [Candidatus Saccharimonadales bacterium]
MGTESAGAKAASPEMAVGAALLAEETDLAGGAFVDGEGFQR